MQRSDSPALARFVIMFTLYITASIWAIWAWNDAWWNLILSQFVLGVLTCSIFACEHETVHATAFKSKALNRYVAILMGLAHFYPSSLFRELHFMHHRHTHVPGLDPEISLGNRPGPSVIGNLPMYLSWLSGFPLLSFKVMMTIMGALGMPEIARKNLYPFVSPKKRMTIALESIVVLSLYVGFLLLALFVNSGFWAVFVGQIVGHCLLSSYLVMEHNGLSHEGDILNKTRSIKTNQFVKLLMWNMPYHAEHHAYPAGPFHALPILHEHIKDELKHKEEGHPDFHLWVLKKTTIGE